MSSELRQSHGSTSAGVATQRQHARAASFAPDESAVRGRHAGSSHSPPLQPAARVPMWLRSPWIWAQAALSPSSRRGPLSVCHRCCRPCRHPEPNVFGGGLKEGKGILQTRKRCDRSCLLVSLNAQPAAVCAAKTVAAEGPLLLSMRGYSAALHMLQNNPDRPQSVPTGK